MFKKTTYSDLEVQEIMETLFLEKKRVKELQVKLGHCSMNSTIPASSEELAKHKAEIQMLLVRLEEGKLREQQSEAKRLQVESELRHLKSSLEAFSAEKAKLKEEHQQAEEEVRRLKEMHHFSENSHPDKQKEAQLERVVQFMRARVEEVEVENHHLLQKIDTFEEKQKTFVEELEQARKASDKLILEKEELKEEEQALKAQMEQLHSEIFKMQNLVHGEKENQEAFKQAQKEIDLLKQMMMKTMQEHKEERNKEESLYQVKVSELNAELENKKAEIETLNANLKEQSLLAEERQTKIDSLNALKSELSEELEQQKRAYQELAQFSEEIKSRILKSDEEKAAALNTLMKKEELIHNLSSQVANLSRSNEKMEDLTRQGEIEKQENEARLRAAQQHLAKKMREMALLTEQYEELKLSNEDQEKTIESFKAKLIEMKAQLDAEAQSKQNIQKQYQEGLKSIEMQSAKWEEKYFQIHEKWQDTEARNRELKRLEERFGKVQNLFGNLGNLLGSPMPIETSEPVEIPIAKKFAEEHSVQTSLFENVPPGRYKESLFG